MKYIIHTEGLHCGHCDAAVETELMKVAGVTDADADHEVNVVEVEAANEIDPASSPPLSRSPASRRSPSRRLRMQADKAKTLRLLKTARGQIDGIMRMVEEDRYCIDVSTQLMATQSMLARINADVLKAHIDHCVRTAVESGTEAEKESKLAEVEHVIDKLAR